MPYTPWDDTINDYAGEFAGDPEFLATVASIIKAESGFRLTAIGDNGESAGPYQMHSRGAGAGMSLQDRMNIDTASSVMVPQYVQAFRQGRQLGLTGPQLAVYVGGRIQRPAAGNERHYGTAYASITGDDYDIGESIADSSNAGRLAGGGAGYAVPGKLPNVGRGASMPNTQAAAPADPLGWMKNLFGGYGMAETKKKESRKQADDLATGIGPLLQLIMRLLGPAAESVGNAGVYAGRLGAAGLSSLGGQAGGTLGSVGSGVGRLAASAGTAGSLLPLGGLAGGSAIAAALGAGGIGGGGPVLPGDPGQPGPSTEAPGANHPGGMAPSRTAGAPGPNHPGGLAPGAAGASPASPAAQAQAKAQQAGGGVQISAADQRSGNINQMEMEDLIRRAYLEGGLDPAFLGNPLVKRSMQHAGSLAGLSALAGLGAGPLNQISNVDRVNQLGPMLSNPNSAVDLYRQLVSQQQGSPADSILAAKAQQMRGAGQDGPVALSPEEQIAANEYAQSGASSPAQFAAKQDPRIARLVASALSGGNLGNQMFLQPWTESMMQQYAAYEPENIMKRKSTLDLLMAAIQGMQGSQRR